jgi:hypothetical protein
MFAALEIKPGESDHAVIQVFFRHAEGMGLEFKTLEPYGRITVGSKPFLRFATDCPDMVTLKTFLQDENRSFVIPTDRGYVLYSQTDEGKVPVTTMQAIKLSGYQRKYRGTLDKFWKRQFT